MKKLRNNILKLGLNPKKEIRNLVLLDLLCLVAAIGSYFLTDSFTYVFIFVLFGIIFSILYVNRYSSMIEKMNAINLEEFTNLFSYFKIYVHNGFSVYSALKELSQFANENLAEMLKTLINEIDNDKSVQPFIKFAKNFNEIIVEEMMLSIYQMVDDGVESDYLIQFELIFDKFSELIYQKNLKRKDSKLATLSSSALIASCYLMIALTVGIIGIIGELINGI